ncbi:MAG TPA: cytochrome ubiquinol oxidase subunit I [Polyangia bacterium]
MFERSFTLSPLLYARAQMGLSLAFHIVFAAAGIALPLLMVIADALWMRTRDPEYRELRQRLAKGTSILFAVGAVSGTVLSFELGLLWPTFMGSFGSVIGIPFALEGFAFFTEAIFLGIYLYGRERVSEGMHLFAGIVVAASGAASAFFVTLVNAFMNLPAGLQVEAGRVVAADPVAAMWSPSWMHQTVHVLLSSYQATAFAMVGIHAFLLLRGRRPSFHRKALGIALPLAIVTALVQPLSGDRSAKQIAHLQPLKLAAAEAHFETLARAPLLVGGMVDAERGRVTGAIPVPGGLSFLAFGDLDARVQGLDAFPRDEWPPVAKVHLAFDTMVGAGTAMAALAALLAAWWIRRRRWPQQRWMLWALVAAAPLGFVALEAGWLVTEWGRQPWLVRGVLKTEAAMTAFPYNAAPFWLFTVLYLFLAAIVGYLMWHQIVATREAVVPEAPRPAGAAHAAE